MYSDLFKTVFVHVPKTAGQSVAHVFLEKHGLTWKTRDRLLMRERRETELGPTRLAHLFAREYVECGYLSPDVFASAFKFATVRNPYERAFSEYRYLARKQRLGQRKFLELLFQPDSTRHLAQQSDFILDPAGKVIVDCVIRFESLQAGFDGVAERIFGRPVPLPRVNSSLPAAPSDVFNGEVKAAVYRRYERDFDLFNYPRR